MTKIKNNLFKRQTVQLLRTIASRSKIEIVTFLN